MSERMPTGIRTGSTTRGMVGGCTRPAPDQHPTSTEQQPGAQHWSPVTKNAKLSILITAIAVLVIAAVIAIVLAVRPAADAADAATPGAGSALPPASNATTHILGEPGSGAVTLVEFLDFECGACAAFHPHVAQLQNDFAGEVTFAFRYFPLPGHSNSVNAAVAVEAASRQNMMQPMYALLLETQPQWGGSGEKSQAPFFRILAEQLGLDLAEYDSDVANPAVFARIQSDFDAGVKLGIGSTPSFFLNDRLLELHSYEDLRAEVEAEIELAR